jgi:fatty acid desaturase
MSSHEALRDTLSILISQLVLIVVLTWVNPLLYPLFWVAPLLTLGSLAHRIKAFCDHARLSTEDETHLYYVTPDWWDYILITMQQRDHGYHHLYPAVPYYHLHKVKNRPMLRHHMVQRKGYIRFLFLYFSDLKNPI